MWTDTRNPRIRRVLRRRGWEHTFRNGFLRHPATGTKVRSGRAAFAWVSFDEPFSVPSRVLNGSPGWDEPLRCMRDVRMLAALLDGGEPEMGTDEALPCVVVALVMGTAPQDWLGSALPALAEATSYPEQVLAAAAVSPALSVEGARHILASGGLPAVEMLARPSCPLPEDEVVAYIEHAVSVGVPQPLLARLAALDVAPDHVRSYAALTADG